MRRRSSSSHQRSHVFLVEPEEAPAGVEKGDPGQRIKKKQPLSHPAVRKVKFTLFAANLYLITTSPRKTPCREVGLQRGTAGGPVQQRLCGILFLFFFFSFLCHHVARRLSEAARGP